MATSNGRMYAGGTPNFDFRTGKQKQVTQKPAAARKPSAASSKRPADMIPPPKVGRGPNQLPPPSKTPMSKRPDRVSIMPVRPGGPGMNKPTPPGKKPGVVRRPGTIVQSGATSKPKKMGRYM